MYKRQEIYSLPIGIEEEISEVIGLKDEKAVKMKGLLHKCDYAASGHYPIEFRNDFLLSGLEYLLMQWNNPADQEKQEIQSAEEVASVSYTHLGRECSCGMWEI